ncbi:FAD:protein FMN transferase [Rhodopirellula halodulae]|uniref:FAD:protein FMN transferase n=1 Tax=Rhodopirellula halodulae TaxID=2894198 RepID=UPI001E3DD299|nr:FAD:protein FMN transferase [Rhodopirellula sp. JC737]MCC9655474.1 FAD:protein FMN transferase [Rhodopirellula sp. JC737]
MRYLHHVAIATVFGLVASLAGAEFASAADLLTFRGATMGTTYMVKVHGAPEREDWEAETATAIERELRSVNDQMSTYLKTSELSRFNASESTDWFEVSADVVDVVKAALELSAQTEGAFDVTVGPLVDRWSFGAGERKRDIPSEEELDQLKEQTGYKNLSARMDPPALKKDIAKLRVDLSSIAKGHGVDRIVALLADRGASDVFVEIGGEVRVSGDKSGESWRVGIQKPDAGGQELLVAHEIRDAAMATSGDYRNFFEVGDQRFSHTIDPRTGRPITNGLASVSVIADNCMLADGWATALSVVGAEEAMKLARQNDLSVLVVQRVGEAFVSSGTGDLSEYADVDQADLAGAEATTSSSDNQNDASFAKRMTPMLILTGIVFGAFLLAMAVGVIFGGKAISGSCGGLNAQVGEDGVSRCTMCSTPSEACQELREKMAEK